MTDPAAPVTGALRIPGKWGHPRELIQPLPEGGRADVWTMGMHVLGLRDVVMRRADVEAGGFDIIEVIRYLSRGEKPVDDGHVIADLSGPRFQVFTQDSPEELAGSPMYNPFGRL